MIASYIKKRLLEEMAGQHSSGMSFASQAWVGLLKEAPTDSGNGSSWPTNVQEVTGTGYRRENIGHYNDSVGRKVEVVCADGKAVLRNTDILFFGECQDTDWGTANYFAIFTSQTNGNIMAWGKIIDSEGEDAPLTPTVNTVPLAKVGSLEISVE